MYFPAISLNNMFPFLEWKHRVTRTSLKKDALAGIVGAVAVLPQSVAFATIAGLPPQYGIYAAIVPAIVAALWGSSSYLVSGPTTAISLVVFTSLAPHAMPGTSEFILYALTLSFLVGVIELLMGFMRLGSLLNFISHTVIMGFTAGAAILIASTQIKNFFGLPVPQGSPFFSSMSYFIEHLPDINPYITAVAIVTLLTGILFRRFWKKIPYMLPAIIVGSLFGVLLNEIATPAVTGIKTVGAISGSFPPLSHPSFDLETISALASSAFAVALLALTEATAIAQAIALRSGERVDNNRELIGQGLSNVFGSFFSAYPASGSFNRSGLNYEAGAQTPLASVFASLVLVVIVLFVMPLAMYLPLAVMAAILFLVAWGLIDFHHIHETWKASPRETSLLLVTFLSTLFIELEFAIFIGMFFSIALYLHRSSVPVVINYLPDPHHPKRRFTTDRSVPRCPQLSIIRIEGALFFGSVYDVEMKLQRLAGQHPEERYLLIIADSLPVVDLAGAEMLVREQERRRKRGGDLFVTNLGSRVSERFAKAGYIEKLGGDTHIFDSKHDALSAIIPKLVQEICAACPARIFQQCPGAPS